MSDPSAKNQGLLKEISALRQRVQKLEKSNAEYKRINDVLRESEEFCQTLLSESPDPLFLLTPAGQYKYVNRAFSKSIGRPVEDIIGRFIGDVFATEEANKRISALSHAFRTGEKTIFAGPVPHVEGDRHYLTTVYPIKDTKGKIDSAICSSKDITDCKKAEDDLRESKELYTKLINTIPDIMVRMNLDGEILFINDVGLQLGGFQASEVIGQNMLSFIAPEDRDKAMRNTALMFEGRLGPQEYHLITKDGRKLLFEVNGDILRNQDGSPYEILHICRDITMRKRAEDEAAVIAEIRQVISSSLDINKIYDQFARHVRELISFDRLSVDINSPDESISIISYVYGFDIPGRRPGDTIPMSGTISETILRTRTGLLINMASPEDITDRFPHLTNVSTIRAGMLSLISVPLIFRDEVIGALHFRSKSQNAYTEQDLSLAARIGLQISGAIANAQLYDELRRAHDTLEAQVRERTTELEEINTALRVLIKNGNMDQKQLAENLQSNVDQLVTPFLSKLRVSQSNQERMTLLNILETNLNNILSPFINKLSTNYKNMTPKEIQIAELIKQGKRSKEIAELFSISLGTVITHRNNIRKKLHLKSTDTNLRSHLLSLS